MSLRTLTSRHPTTSDSVGTLVAMAFIAPVRRHDQLPQLDTEIEREVMEWKAPGQIKQAAFHKAKDVAAFANHLGGVILVCEGRGGKLAKYEGLAQTTAKAMADEFSRAVEQKCDPVPQIDPVAVSVPGDATKVVLAVNVAPSLRLIGIRADVDSKVEDWASPDKAFVYPIRTGTTTRFLTPGEFPMFMTPHVRRVAVLLSRIPANTQVRVIWQRRESEPLFIFLGVEEEKNVVLLKNFEGPTRRALPLDGIASVYEGENSDGTWFGWRIVPTDALK